MEQSGGGFLVGDPVLDFEPHDVARAAGKTARDLTRARVLPQNAVLEAGDHRRLRGLLAEVGELGLLSAELSAERGGCEADPATLIAIASGLGQHIAFGVTCAAHSTIGTVPVLRYGSAELQAELLPKLAAGKLVGAYALTEAGGGSDALNLSTRAVQSSPGSDWRITGAKQFVTNAGIADIVIVFAAVEGAGPTAFVVDAGGPGVELGAEEKKLGLHGSSTRALFLDGAPGRPLSSPGRGHRVALDALTIGRHKLGALASGHLELLLEQGAMYARERHQFGRPIGERAQIVQLLGEAIVRGWELRAMVARAAPHCSPHTKDLVPSLVEAALCKLAGAEALCSVADGVLQIFGGLGYLRGSWVEQSYRDARVNRIYEGTDEINRRAATHGLVRAARRGWLPLDVTGPEARAALASDAKGAAAADGRAGSGDPLADEARGLASHVRRMALVALHALCDLVDDEAKMEELEAPIAELALAAYASDSAARRARGRGELAGAAAVLSAARAVERGHSAWSAIAAMLPDGLPVRGLSLADIAPRLDRAALRRLLANAALEAGRDPLVDWAPIRAPAPC